jgi:alkylation response protein AidB-like acyl-CoA dehydrogenase
MDFNDTAAEAAFRTETREWLAMHAPAFCNDLPQDRSGTALAECGRRWQRQKAQAGFGAIGLPIAVGGRDATPMMEVIFGEEEARFPLPVGPFVTIGTQLVVPTILQHGTEGQQNDLVRRTLTGDLLWCQLFSEPAAGSDLAGLRTRAVRDGSDWVVTGQKVWNSWAHAADWAVLIARTDPEVAKHRGLTYFVMDMRLPGVEVRPIRQISGESEFNEVFLTDVRIPNHCVVGAPGDGWKVAMTTLMNERISAGTETTRIADSSLLRELISRKGAAAASYRLRTAQLIAQELGLKYFRARLLTQLSREETPSASAAMSKLVFANLLQDLSAIALEVEGLEGLYPSAPSEDIERLQHGYFWAAAMRIAGGADEVLRNQLAERVLGLPGDLRVDKNVPFSAVPAAR